MDLDDTSTATWVALFAREQLLVAAAAGLEGEVDRLHAELDAVVDRQSDVDIELELVREALTAPESTPADREEMLQEWRLLKLDLVGALGGTA